MLYDHRLAVLPRSVADHLATALLLASLEPDYYALST